MLVAMMISLLYLNKKITNKEKEDEKNYFNWFVVITRKHDMG